MINDKLTVPRNRVTPPMRRVLDKLKQGCTLHSSWGAPDDRTSPWLEVPGTTQKLYVSYRSVESLCENHMVELDPKATPRQGIHTWRITPLGFKA